MQMFISEVIGNLQHSFSIDQLEKLEAVPKKLDKYNIYMKDKYQFDLFDWLYFEMGKKKIHLMNKKLI